MPFPLILSPPGNAEFSAGFLAPPGYIDGLELQYGSAGSLTVLPGTAYIPSLGYAVNVPTALTASFSGNVTGFQHVYLYVSSGTPTVEVSSTAPTSYTGSGTGKTKTGDTSRRYLGSIYRTGAAGAYANFLQTGNHVRWLTTTVSLVAGGTSTSYTSGGAINPVTAGACPPTTHELDIRCINSDTTYGFSLSNADAGYTALVGVTGGTYGAYLSVPLNQQATPANGFAYAFSNSPSVGSATIVATGYTFER